MFLTRLDVSAVEGRLAAYWRTPLTRNGYALVFSSAASSVLGAVYWIVAARLYSEEALGASSAALSAMMFVGGIAQLNLATALVRFLPEAGHKSARFILTAYGVAVAVATPATALFLFGIAGPQPSFSSLMSIPLFGIWFTLAAAAWGMHNLQAAVLIGLRQATWVPVREIVFSVLKIGLVMGLAFVLPQYGVFGSWVLSLVVILPVNYLIFRRLLPRHVANAGDRPILVGFSHIAKFASADYVGAMSWIGVTTLLPVLVGSIEGPAAVARFWLAWQVAFNILVVTGDMGFSMIVEVAHDNEKLATYSRRVFKNSMLIVAPAAIACALAAPLIMSVFGHSYSEGGAEVLQFLALGAIPSVFTLLAVCIARARRKAQVASVNFALLFVLTIGLGYVLLRAVGLTGVGVAWLSAQSIVAMFVWFTQIKPLWNSQHPEPIARFLAMPRNQMPTESDLGTFSTRQFTRNRRKLDG